MKGIKKICSIVIVLALTFLTACSGKEDSASIPESPSEAFQPTYTSQLSSDIQYIDYLSKYENYVYAAIFSTDNKQIIKISANNEEVETYAKLSENIYGMTVSDSGIVWLIIGEETEDESFIYSLVSLNDDGQVNESDSILLDFEITSIIGLHMDNSGNFYINTLSQVYVLNNAGEMLFNIDCNTGEVTAKALDGSICTLVTEGNETSIAVLNPDKKKIEKTYTLTDANGLTEGWGEWDICYYNNTGLYGYHMVSGTSVELINWNDAGVYNIKSVLPLKDGRILGVKFETS